MNQGMDKIVLLDACRREMFRQPVFRLIEAQHKVSHFYHENPIQRDLFAEYEAIAAWGIVTTCYSGIEQTMKCLLKMRSAFNEKKHRHHDIGKLFDELAREEQEVLGVSYRIYRSLHDYIPPETIVRFLEAIDEGYNTWRYFLLEGEMPPSTHPGAMLEIWSALADILKAKVFTNHGLYSVEKRIRHNLNENTLQDAWVAHVDADVGQREIDDINRWMQTSHNNVTMNAYIDFIYQHAERRLHLIEVLPSTKELLSTMVGIVKEKRFDNDFDHFIRRAQMGNIVWNPHTGLFENTSRTEEIKIKLIESDHSYFEESTLGPSVKADFVELVPDYIEDFIFEPRVDGEIADDDWSTEDEDWKARLKYYEERKARIREYEGGIECEGYRCHISGMELVIVLYDSREWIVYRYHNEEIPGVPHYCKRFSGRGRSIREKIRAIEHWRRTEKKQFETFRNSVWKRRGKEKKKHLRGNLDTDSSRDSSKRS